MALPFTVKTCLVPFNEEIIQDSHFPRVTQKLGPLTIISNIQSLIEKYTKRELTIEQDRRIAFSGLESRLERTFLTVSRFGILGTFLPFLLLWSRLDGDQTPRIEYIEDQKVPSWSWMTYSGAVKFELEASDSFERARTLDFGYNKHQITGCLGAFQRCRLPGGASGKIHDMQGNEIGSLICDRDSDSNVSSEKCVVVGRDNRRDGPRRYHFLLVHNKGAENEYERAAVGWIHEGFVLKLKVRAILV